MSEWAYLEGGRANEMIILSYYVVFLFSFLAVGIQWSNMWDTGNPRDDLTPAMILLMFVFDIFLYILVMWYVDQISPGKYGVPLPFYFPLQVRACVLL